MTEKPAAIEMPFWSPEWHKEATRQIAFRGRLKPGAVLGRIAIVGHEHGDEVAVNPNLTPIPVFDDGMPKEIRGLPVLETLEFAGNFILNEVLPMFRKFV